MRFSWIFSLLAAAGLGASLSLSYGHWAARSNTKTAKVVSVLATQGCPQVSSKILVVVTTDRPGSLSGVVARHYQKLIQKHGGRAEILDLATLPNSFPQSAQYGRYGEDAAFKQFVDQVRAYQKYVFIVPEYNGSFPGIFKCFLDALPYPRKLFEGKICALVGVSIGRQGALSALSHLTDIFHHEHMDVLPFKPKLSGVMATTLEAVQAHAGYLERLEKQAIALLTAAAATT